MKLLITTQSVDVNDPVLGFFHNWILEFAKRCEKVTIICLREGKHNLPANVRVLSLGKPKAGWSPSRAHALKQRTRALFNFYKYIWRARASYDTVFAHMNPIYVVLGGFLWRLFGKKISLWYVHRSVNWQILTANLFVDNIFTASKESCRIKSNKIHIVGHGILVNDFKKPENHHRALENKLKIISVGRITKIKNLDTLIEACAILRDEGVVPEVSLAGPKLGENDEKYFAYLKKLISEKDLEKEIKFLGAINNERLPEYYWRSDFSINLCPTGGVDKVMLEAMAAGCVPLASNRSFAEYFGEYVPILLFKERNAVDLAEKIIAIRQRHDLEKIKRELSYRVSVSSDLPILIGKVLHIIKQNGKTGK